MTISVELDNCSSVLDVEVAEETIRVWLRDGRTMTVPLAWYPRLCDGTPAERNNWESVGDGIAVHWPDLDEDIGIAEMLSVPGTGSLGVDEHPRALDVEVAEETIRVWLRDGRTMTVPLAWYPRLCDGTPVERNNWESVGDGIAVHWPDLDEDVSIGGLMSGPSLERATTLGRWLLARREGRGVKGYEIAEHERTRRAVPLR